MHSGHSDLNLAQVMVLHLQMMSFKVIHDTSIQAEKGGTGKVLLPIEGKMGCRMAYHSPSADT